MAKKDKPVYGFMRKVNFLVPAMAFDLLAIECIAEGELVKVEIQQFRNVQSHRAYWATLQDVIDACGLEYNSEKLHDLALQALLIAVWPRKPKERVMIHYD